MARKSSTRAPPVPVPKSSRAARPSSDRTKAIAAEYKARVIDVASVHQQPEGFAGARNVVLQQCTGDWFLWIDTDEQLVDGYWLRRYLEGSVFNGFVLQQTHLYLDG